MITVHGPQDVPDGGGIEEFREPIVKISFLIPAENIGSLMGMCTERRGTFVRTEYLSQQRVILVFEMPLAEVIYDLYDKLKSVTHGYGTMDYEVLGYREADLVKHGHPRPRPEGGRAVGDRPPGEHRAAGPAMLKKLREEIDRHLFEVALQAAIGARVVARENIAAMRKNVTAKCYGGDITRKRKLWAKQAEGKKRMKQIGQVEVPQEAFLAVLEQDGLRVGKTSSPQSHRGTQREDRKTEARSMVCIPKLRGRLGFTCLPSVPSMTLWREHCDPNPAGGRTP